MNDRLLKLACPTFLLAFSLISFLPSVSCHMDRGAQKQIYFQSGMEYLQRSRYPEAIIQFQNAIQIDNRFASAHYQLAQCYLRRGEWQDAQKELLTTVELDPRNSQAQLDLGRFLFQVGQFQRPKAPAHLLLTDSPTQVKPPAFPSTTNPQL